MDAQTLDWILGTLSVLLTFAVAYLGKWGREQAKKTEGVEDDALVEELAKRVEGGQILLETKVRERLARRFLR